MLPQWFVVDGAERSRPRFLAWKSVQDGFRHTMKDPTTGLPAGHPHRPVPQYAAPLQDPLQAQERGRI